MAQQQKNQPQQSEEKGSMTVEEAGRMGGQRVRELVEEGKEREGESGGGAGGSSGRSEKSGGSQNR